MILYSDYCTEPFGLSNTTPLVQHGNRARLPASLWNVDEGQRVPTVLKSKHECIPVCGLP